MVAVVETVPEMNTAVSVLLIIRLEGRQDSEFYSGSITILLYRSNDLDGHEPSLSLVTSLDNFAEGSLAEETSYLVFLLSASRFTEHDYEKLTSVCEIRFRNYNVMPIVIVHFQILGV